MCNENESTANGKLEVNHKGLNLVEGVKTVNGTMVKISVCVLAPACQKKHSFFTYNTRVCVKNPDVDHWFIIGQSDWVKYINEQEISEVKDSLWKSIRPDIVEGLDDPDDGLL